MNITVLSWEAAPFARGGILADEIKDLCEGLSLKASHSVTLVMPRHGTVDRRALGAGYEGPVQIQANGTNFTFGVFSCTVKKVRVLFIEHDLLFDRSANVYDSYDDECLRVSLFTRAAVDFLSRQTPHTDILISHEWQTALAPAFVKCLYSDSLRSTKCVLHVHSFQYGGIFNKFEVQSTTLGWAAFCEEHMKYHDGISLLKSGLLYCDAVLSDTFNEEEAQMPEGFTEILAPVIDKCKIISPYHTAPHNINDAEKLSRRESLQLKCSLELKDYPLFTFSGHGNDSGIQLLINIIGTVLSDKEARFCIMHDGLGSFEDLHCAQLLSRSFPGKVAFYCGINGDFEDELFSASDFHILCSTHPDTRGILRAFKSRSIPLSAKSSISEKLCSPQNAHPRGLLYYPALEYQLYKTVCTAINIYHTDRFSDLREHAAAYGYTVVDYIADYLDTLKSL